MDYNLSVVIHIGYLLVLILQLKLDTIQIYHS